MKRYYIEFFPRLEERKFFVDFKINVDLLNNSFENIENGLKSRQIFVKGFLKDCVCVRTLTGI